MKIIGQFHDEVIALVEEGDTTRTETIMQTSIKKTNEKVQLNVPLAIDYSFGKNYSEIH
jgi:DNA polymerase I-like protein with 3'-5' exonuclease and polymerase domains